MSKKHKQGQAYQAGSGVGILSHEAEYRIIKHDLIKVLILNVVYFGFLVVLYLSNQKTHFLDTWLTKVLHF